MSGRLQSGGLGGGDVGGVGRQQRFAAGADGLGHVREGGDLGLAGQGGELPGGPCVRLCRGSERIGCGPACGGFYRQMVWSGRGVWRRRGVMIQNDTK
jgi:hypothetical protein